MQTKLSTLPSPRLRALAVGIAAAASLACGVAAAAETTFIGYTDGCFSTSSCSPQTEPGAQSATFLGLTYKNSTFDATTADGFLSIGAAPTTPNFNNLGSFSLTGAPFRYNGEHFDLRVTFTAPPGTTPNSVVIEDVLTGTVSSINNGGVFIDFDNTVKNFAFGSGDTSGTFSFFVNDLSVTAGQTVAVTGTIMSQVTPVPEPETYALMMAGLGALGFVARRRKPR